MKSAILVGPRNLLVEDIELPEKIKFGRFS